MHKKNIYMDNAATSNFKPLSVKWAFFRSLKNSANPGRSGHNLSIKNALRVWEARETIAKHFGVIEPENVIFTKNCTEALNIAILGLCKSGGNVVCSCFEHNSVLRPLKHLENEGKITLTIAKPKNKKFITKSDIEEILTPKTYLVCITHISNVTGNKNEIENIGKLCKQKGILFLVDCAQSCGHEKIDMKKQNINYIAFAGHKGLLSPQGIGGLCINSNTLPLPLIHGGTGTESENLFQPLAMPERLESGTLATPLICSISAGVKYVDKHFEKNNKKIADLTQYLIKKLKPYQTNGNVKLYTLETATSGVICFNITGVDSIEATNYLDNKYNIATRGGLHCAPLAHTFLETLSTGAIRVSLSFKNTKKQVDLLLRAVDELIKANNI